MQVSRPILITGGSGFIGRNLVEHYSKNNSVLAPSHSELDLLDEDAVRDYFRAHEVDVVVHSATKPGHRNASDPTGLVYSNTRMFFNLARNRDRFRKLIFLGTGAVYDTRHYRPKMAEEYFDVHVPVDETGYSKYLIAKHIAQSGNMVELRPFGVFGKHEDYAIRFISNAICKALFDLPITIKQNRRFDYVFIDDLVEVVDFFVEHDGAHKAYNVTPDEAVELYTLAEKVRDASGKDLPIAVAEPGYGPEYSGDNSRLRREIPDMAFTPIDVAIRRLYDWYAANLHFVDKTVLETDK